MFRQESDCLIVVMKSININRWSEGDSKWSCLLRKNIQSEEVKPESRH